ncbi:hypothetical protein EV360DRAFT_90525 [Lentinula raphanica]|nr:hypothetical protein EV360DRAFT_90525 [Lentinula raphanica]
MSTATALNSALERLLEYGSDDDLGSDVDVNESPYSSSLPPPTANPYTHPEETETERVSFSPPGTSPFRLELDVRIPCGTNEDSDEVMVLSEDTSLSPTTVDQSSLPSIPFDSNGGMHSSLILHTDNPPSPLTTARTPPGSQNDVMAPIPRSVHKSSVLQFLDIEAIDSDQDMEDGDEMSEGEGFIDDTALSTRNLSVPLGVIPQIQPRANPFLRHLEDVYGQPRIDNDCTNDEPVDQDQDFEDFSVDDLLALNNREKHWVEKMFPDIDHQPTDWVLLSVECKAGSEYSILFDLMNTRHIEGEVRSAFFNPSLENHLYLESSIPRYDKSVLVEFLTTHSDIRPSTLKRIPFDLHKSCLWVRPRNQQLFTQGTWVKIDSPGHYQGDVGLVRGLRSFPGRLAVLVLLVPRTRRKDDPHMTARPALELKLTADLESVGAQKYISSSGEYYVDGHQVFQSGLIMMYLSPASLSVARGISGQIRSLLIQSENPFVLERRHSMPIPEHWKFNEGDEVLIFDEEFTGSSPCGLVRSVLNGSCEVEHELDGSVKDLVIVRMDKLVKSVAPGDYVKVLVGIHAELSGIVGEKNGRVLGLIPDNSYNICVWVDANSIPFHGYRGYGHKRRLSQSLGG